MLDIARADRPHPRVSCRLFDGRPWTGSPTTASMPPCAAWCCTDPDDGRPTGLTASHYRVPRPGAPYVLADLGPAATGVAFSTLRRGEPDAVYGDRGTVTTLLRLRDGTTMTTTTHRRSHDRYRTLLVDPGFPSPAVDLPTLRADGLLDELRRRPGSRRTGS
ncbi:hypothetical protein [Streptomyces sp. NPDC058294]|uniref:hypothetical protein n=1 Tax=Streptomyces sp. NPDC058294 TaxID=3346430 RepID=UPI0036EBD775